MRDLTHTEILQRVHKIKRAALTGGAAPALTTALDDLADAIAFGVPGETGTYSTPRECDFPGCDFTTLSRHDYWDHATKEHGV